MITRNEIDSDVNLFEWVNLYRVILYLENFL